MIVAQLAKHLGMRVIKVVDVAKHGAQLSQGPADLIVDSYDSERAVEIIRRVTKGNLRFGVDVVGTKTATLLRRTLREGDENMKSHLVGLSGLPKDPVVGIQNHTVPIKLHHDVPAVGEAMMIWLEKLLATGKLVPPQVEVLAGGLPAINDGLDRMRKGEISGRRLAVNFS
jgi:threonine dehydrogenase-like Zn-dependent dehydrogenase